MSDEGYVWLLVRLCFEQPTEKYSNSKSAIAVFVMFCNY